MASSFPHPAEPARTATRSHRSLVVGLTVGLSVGALAGGIAAPTALGVGAASTPSVSLGVQAQEDNETIVSVAERLLPAVVTIEVSAQVDDTSQTDPFGRGFGFGDGSGQMVTGTGSGVIIDPDGLILTNRHVVADADMVSVTMSDGSVHDGTVVGIDTYTDFALVRIEGSDLPAATLGDSSDLRIGQLAVAIGSPLGRFYGSVSSGIVSGLDRTINVGDGMSGAYSRLSHLIQTDAAINPGNSGGALVDGDGRIIGINTAMAGGAQGIGFALPIDIAKPIIEQIKDGAEIARPWMGVSYRDIDAQLADDEGLDVVAGAWIAPVPKGGQGTPIVDGSPADDAGLKGGDIIVKVGEQAIDRDHPLDLVLLTHEPGETVILTVLRDGEERTINLTLGTRPADLGR